MECTYCKKILSCTSSLNLHIKTNKKCKELQADVCKDNKPPYICTGCGKKYTTKGTLLRHSKVCTNNMSIVYKLNSRIKMLLDDSANINAKLEECEIECERQQFDLNCVNNKLIEKDNIIHQKDTIIAELNAKIDLYKEFSSSYTGGNTTNNNTTNTVNNIIVSSLDIMDDPVKLNRLIEEHYSTDYFIEGQVGVAKFSNDHLVTDDDGQKLYICTDTSRNSFKYKNVKGEIVKDPHGTKFANNLLDNGLKDMARKHSNTLLKRDYDFTNVTSKFFEIDDMGKDTKKFCKHLGSLVSL
jgi:hypothetical protein